MKVLVTDGQLKAALAAVRHLGRRGIEIHTTKSVRGRTVSEYSRFHRTSHLLPPPQSPAFQEKLITLLENERFDYLFPVSDLTLQRISGDRERVSSLVRMDLPPRAALDLVLSKSGLLRTAQNLGLSVPKTVIYKGEKYPDAQLCSLGFPMVAKSFPGETYDRIRYINDEEELASFLHRCERNTTLLFQEYIEGTGNGFFAFFENGKLICSQMHERIWEYPVTGGPSVFARTINDPVLKELGNRLLSHLDWNGVAMVEFKKAKKDGVYTLMEVNPRLWGSLDLSIASGADLLSISLARDKNAASKLVAVKKASFLWFLPDSLLFLISRPKELFRFLKALFSSKIRKDVHLDDIWPLLHQGREFFYWLKILLPKGRLRYPHGRPIKTGVQQPEKGDTQLGPPKPAYLHYPIRQETSVPAIACDPAEQNGLPGRKNINIKKVG